jgi:solute carrier family 15 (oligopeptide transporter), member 1
MKVMFSVTGYEFAFTQAPESMKSVIQAFWMVKDTKILYDQHLISCLQLTVACGNLIVSLVVASDKLDNQVMKFLLFAVLMFIDMIVFMFLAYRFKPKLDNHLTLNS